MHGLNTLKRLNEEAAEREYLKTFPLLVQLLVKLGWIKIQRREP